MQGALERQADAALHACTKVGVSSEQVVSELLNLVTIDEQGRPTKRRVALDDLSAAAADMLDPFISRRLLSTAAEGDRTFVGVAHEAFLVSWPPLKTEIDSQATALRARRVVENAADDWAAGGRDASALLQGRQLAKSTVDTGAVLRRVIRAKPSRREGGNALWCHHIGGRADAGSWPPASNSIKTLGNSWKPVSARIADADTVE